MAAVAIERAGGQQQQLSQTAIERGKCRAKRAEIDADKPGTLARNSRL